MKRILVTGANGLLGSQVARILAQEGHEVFALVRPNAARPHQDVTYVEVDLLSDDLAQRLPTNLDAIMQLAQSSKFRNFPDDASDIFGVNVLSTFRLLEFAKTSHVKHFVFTSSGGIYEDSLSPRLESSSVALAKNLGFYLGTKASAETFCLNYASLFQVSILRPFFIYGSSQKPEMLIPRLINSVTSGTALPIDGDQGLELNPIYVTDAAMAAVASLGQSEGQIVNVAGPESITLVELANLIGDVVNRKPIFSFTASPAKSMVANIDLMTHKLWAPRVLLREGIELMIRGSREINPNRTSSF